MQISLVLDADIPYFSVPKKVRSNSTQYLIMKSHNKREVQQIAFNDSTVIGYKDFMKIYRERYK